MECSESHQDLVPTEDSMGVLGSKGLIKKHELIRVIIQCLYSLGYQKSACNLESESGVSHTSSEYKSLETQIPGGNWDDCIKTLCSIKDFTDDTRESALFLVLKQCISEHVNRGDDDLALDFLQKKKDLLLNLETVEKLAYCMMPLKGTFDDNDVPVLRKGVLTELEKLLPPRIILPEGRLEHLVETVVMSQVDSCVYHNLPGPVSIYGDHRCDRNQIPTETTQVLTGHKKEVWFVQFSNNGEYLASSSRDCTVIIWKVMDDDKVKVKHVFQSQNPVTYVAWSPDDTKLLTSGNVEALVLWDVEEGTCKRTFVGHDFIVSSCAWFPDSERFVCGSADPVKGIHLWDCDGNKIKSWKGPRVPEVSDLAITPDGEYLISALGDKDIRVLNVAAGGVEHLVGQEEHVVTSLSVSGDGKFLIVNLIDIQEIHLWDVAGKWGRAHRYKGHAHKEHVIRSCFGGLNDRFIASGSEDTKVYIWSRRFSTPIEALPGHSMPVNCVSWNPRRLQMLASASDDNTVRIWGASRSS